MATGSVVEHGGKYHIFYTGYNSVLRKQGKPEQGIMHAVSDDLLKWQKIPAETFFARHDFYLLVRDEVPTSVQQSVEFQGV